MDNLWTSINLLACATYLYLAIGRVYGGGQVVRGLQALGLTRMRTRLGGDKGASCAHRERVKMSRSQMARSESGRHATNSGSMRSGSHLRL